MAFLIVELFLDYIFGMNFRETRWMVFAYVMLLFGATGGMIGVAARAGRAWMITAAVTYLIMMAMSFYQHSRTGL